MALLLALLLAALLDTPAAGPGALPVLPVRVVSGATPRQTFKGFGWSLPPGEGGVLRGNGATPYHAPLGNFSQEVRQRLLTLLCEDLGTTVVRLWWGPNDALDGGWHGGDHGKYDGDEQFAAAYVDSGLVADLRRHGVKQLLLLLA